MIRSILVLLVLATACDTALCADKETPADGKLFIATPLTKNGEFTAGIEGPACDAQGNIYAVSYLKPEVIGKVTPAGKVETFLELPDKSCGNGIVFDRQGIMFIADYVNHNVLRVDPGTKALSVLAHQTEMNQPNDLAIAPDGTLYERPRLGKRDRTGVADRQGGEDHARRR